MIIPRFLYNNVLRGKTTAFSGTTVTAKPPANATDFFDWTLFTANSGNLDYTMSADTAIDSVSIYVKTTAGSNSIVLQYESGAGVFSTLQTYSSPSGSLTFDSFASVTVLNGRKIRFVITAATTMDIRQLIVGAALVPPTGAWSTVTPPSFNQGIRVTNNISANGSFLGRSIERLERSGRIALDYLSDSWVRASWEPFSAHFAKYPFVYSWNQSGQPNDVAYCFVDQVSPPKHTSEGYLSVDIPVRMLVADSEAIT